MSLIEDLINNFSKKLEVKQFSLKKVPVATPVCVWQAFTTLAAVAII